MRILRETIPVDDQDHVLKLSGPIVHVATRAEDAVEVWRVDDPTAPEDWLQVRVVGTGHEYSGNHLGSAITPSGRLVWHLIHV